MAWSVLVGSVSAGTANVVVAPNASHAAGDIELLFVASDNGTTCALTTAAGFAAVTGGQSVVGTGPSTTSATVTTFWRRWNGTDGNVTITDTGNHTIGVIVSVRGALASGTPWEAVTASSEATADTSGSATGGSTSVADCLVLIAAATAVPDADSDNIEFSAWANAALSSLTERVDVTRTAGNGGGLGIATGVKATAGAIGATTYTTTVNTAKAHVTLALKPASNNVTGTASWAQAAATWAASLAERIAATASFSQAAASWSASSAQRIASSASFSQQAAAWDAGMAEELAATAAWQQAAATWDATADTVVLPTFTASWAQEVAAWDALASVVNPVDFSAAWQQAAPTWDAEAQQSLDAAADFAQAAATWDAAMAQQLAFAADFQQAAATWDALVGVVNPIDFSADWQQAPATWDAEAAERIVATATWEQAAATWTAADSPIVTGSATWQQAAASWAAVASMAAAPTVPTLRYGGAPPIRYPLAPRVKSTARWQQAPASWAATMDVERSRIERELEDLLMAGII